MSDLDMAAHGADVFRLLGDPTRLRMLLELERADELCVHDIAHRARANETTVSQALRLLRTAGVVRNRRQGRHIYYRLDDDHVRRLLGVMREHIACGEH
jgi:ArsR family transcriptional regulator, lead/cadmium/zinc/bismuth-responsive transcriptional repressor